MTIYFYFYKLAPWQALATMICSVISILAGIYFKIAHMKFLGSITDHPGLAEVDASIFKDAYLHPCFRKHREYEESQMLKSPLILEFDPNTHRYSKIRNGTSPLLSDSIEMENSVGERSSLIN